MNHQNRRQRERRGQDTKAPRQEERRTSDDRQKLRLHHDDAQNPSDNKDQGRGYN